MSNDARWPSQAELLRRARRRTTITRLSSMVVLTVSVVLIGKWITPSPHPARRALHNSAMDIAITVAIAAIILGGTALFLLRRSRRPDSVYAPWSVTGLPRRSRREVMRHIRQGTPGANPDLAAVEVETARRLVGQGHRSFIIIGIVTAVSIGEILLGDGWRLRLFFGAITIGALPMTLFTVRQIAQARQYLARSGRSQPISHSDQADS